MKTLLVIVLILVLAGLGAGGYYLYMQQYQPTSTTHSPTSIPLTPTVPVNAPVTTQETGIQEIKSAHFEDSTPAHNSVFAAAPMNVVINFNFDLADNSTIAIEKDGVDYGNGATNLDPNKRSMRRVMKAAPDGVYTVNYTACWPDRTCHDGTFAFTIDSAQLSKYTDMTDRMDVAVDLKNIAISPPFLVISRGTTVIWTNGDADIHYVNADSHPFHTFVLALNSEALMQGDTFSYTFTDPGEYPYHCSAHAAEMTGRIVVK
jgi:plastocyanin